MYRTVDIQPNYLNKFLNQESEYKNRKDELVCKITEGINDLRRGTKYKPTTKKRVAIQINKHPILKNQMGELELLYKDCMARGNFSKFYWVCPER